MGHLNAWLVLWNQSPEEDLCHRLQLPWVRGGRLGSVSLFPFGLLPQSWGFILSSRFLIFLFYVTIKPGFSVAEHMHCPGRGVYGHAPANVVTHSLCVFIVFACGASLKVLQSVASKRPCRLAFTLSVQVGLCL